MQRKEIHPPTLYKSPDRPVASLLELDLAHKPVMYIVFDQQRFELAISDEFVSSLGFSREEWLQNPYALWENRLHPDDREEVLPKAATLSSATTPLEMSSIYRLRPKIGAPIWISDTVQFDGYTFMSRMEDITEQIRVKVTTQAAEILVRDLDFDAVINNLQRILSGILPYDKANVVLEEHGKWITKMKWSIADDGNLHIEKTDEGFRMEGKQLIVDMLQNRIPAFVTDTSNATSGYVSDHAGSWVGTPICVGEKVIGFLQLNSNTPNSYNEKDAKFLQTFSRFLAIAVKNAQLHESTYLQAIKDGLTGIYNHRHFEELSTRELKQAIRGGLPLCFGILDVDLFKEAVNDAFGHSNGDRVLIETTARLQKVLREIDILGRWGGDEFAVTLLNTRLTDGYYVAERLRSAIASIPFELIVDLNQINVSVTISLGLSFPKEDDSFTDLYNRADYALSVVKQRGGRNAVGIYIPRHKLEDDEMAIIKPISVKRETLDDGGMKRDEEYEVTLYPRLGEHQVAEKPRGKFIVTLNGETSERNRYLCYEIYRDEKTRAAVLDSADFIHDVRKGILKDGFEWLSALIPVFNYPQPQG